MGDDRTASEPSRGALDVPNLAAYIAGSLTKTARECGWQDDLTGNAGRFLCQDLGEFAETMVACGRAGYWSPAKALERLFMERVEVLLGTTSSDKVAKRYLDTLMTEASPSNPLKPATRARPEDALTVFLDGHAENWAPEFRNAWLSMKNPLSDWFVHPTVMGPMLSFESKGAPELEAQHWLHLVHLLAWASVFVLLAATKLGVSVPPEIVRSIGAGGECLEQAGIADGAALFRSIHSTIVAQVKATAG